MASVTEEDRSLPFLDLPPVIRKIRIRSLPGPSMVFLDGELQKLLEHVREYPAYLQGWIGEIPAVIGAVQVPAAARTAAERADRAQERTDQLAPALSTERAFARFHGFTFVLRGTRFFSFENSSEPILTENRFGNRRLDFLSRRPFEFALVALFREMMPGRDDVLRAWPVVREFDEITNISLFPLHFGFVEPALRVKVQEEVIDVEDIKRDPSVNFQDNHGAPDPSPGMLRHRFAAYVIDQPVVSREREAMERIVVVDGEYPDGCSHVCVDP